MKTTDFSEIVKAAIEGRWLSLAATILSVILVLLVAWIAAYVKQKGKHLATHEDFREILQQTGDIRREEQKAGLQALADNIELKLKVVRGEVAATKEAEIEVIQRHLSQMSDLEAAKKGGELKGVYEHLDKLVVQVEAVTAKTEEIKKRVGQEIWMEQTIRNERRAIYGELCKIIGGLIHNHEQMLRVAEALRGDNPDMMDLLIELHDNLQHNEAPIPDELKPMIEEHLRLTKLLLENRTQLRIFCRPAALRAFDAFVAAGLGTTVRPKIRQALEDVQVLEKRIASVASLDLGLPVQGFPDTQAAAKAEITCPECFRVGSIARPLKAAVSCPNPNCKAEFEVLAY
ncbi:MAG: hypothetical protein ACLQAT_20180 [Candidatus Binataceae bacterium]